MLRIDLTSLHDGVHQFDLPVEAGEINLDPEKFADIRVKALVDYHRGRALVAFEAFATATLECDRTLALFEHPVEGSYAVLFVPPTFGGGAQAAEGSEYEEVREWDPSQPVLDLTDVVRDTLLLALPVRCIAPGAEDVDLQVVFGAPEQGEEGEIDPRWEALRKLRSGGTPQ